MLTKRKNTSFAPSSYAEMTGDEKNMVSHRFKALGKMRDYFLARS